MTFCPALSVDPIRERDKKSQHTLDEFHQSDWPYTLLHISPSVGNGFTFLERPQILLEACSMMGEARNVASNITCEMSVKIYF